MKKLLGIMVLGLLLINPSQADDIRDFQIEGMSVGDSLLDYFSEKEIKKATTPFKKTNYKDDTFSRTIPKSKKLEVFEYVQFQIKKDDPKYIIYGVTGKILYKKNIDQCYKDMGDFVTQVENLALDAKKREYKKNHSADKTGKSKNTTVQFNFDTGDQIRISCYDWSKKMKYADNLRLGVLTNEFIQWLQTKAYK